MWTVIAFAITALFYLGAKVADLFTFEGIAEWTKFRQFSLGLLIVLGFSGIIMLCIDFVNAIVCVMYVAMIWAVSDFSFWAIEKIFHISFEQYWVGLAALAVSIFALGVGWYLDHKVWQTNYELVTDKNVPNLRVAMFADAHLGTTFDAEGFAKHLEVIETQEPDIVVVVGDYVDDNTKKEDMVKASKALGKMKTKYGVYFVFGNHDKGYYGAAHRGFSAAELVNELGKSGVEVLRDENVLINNAFYIIGRRDYSVEREHSGKRKSMAELVKDLDRSKYMIVLDHQPTEFDKQADAEVDLVLSGHTHGGQMFPFNQVGKWIGANDLVYGHEKRKNTDFIVTSGISDWAIKFKTGTKSEFVIIDIKKDK